MRVVKVMVVVASSRHVVVEEGKTAVLISSAGATSEMGNSWKDNLACMENREAKQCAAANWWCSTFERDACPTWETVVLHRHVLLVGATVDASTISCDIAPPACVSRWNSRYKGDFCSGNVNKQANPTWDQLTEYLNLFEPSSNDISKCFFPGKSFAGNGVNFGPNFFKIGECVEEKTAQLAQISDSLSARAAAPTLAQVHAAALEGALEEKEDTAVAEGSTVDTGVDTSMPITLLDQQAFGCDDPPMKRAVECIVAFRSSNAEMCSSCLEQGDPVPDCTKNNLSPIENHYCDCKTQ